MGEIVTEKICKGCGISKPLSDFYRHFSNTDGWNKRCKQCLSEKQASYREKNREVIRERDKIYRDKNRDRIREKQRLYTRTKRASVTGTRKYRKLNPKDSIKIKDINRHFRRRGSVGYISEEQWVNLCNFYGNKCLWCGSTTDKLTLDHVVPVVMGGESTINNIQPLCKDCNSKKHAKYMDFRPDKGMYAIQLSQTLAHKGINDWAFAIY